MDLRNQRRMASEILKCGLDRVWIDPDTIEDVAEAVTREDIRDLINSKVIRKKQKIGISRGRARKIALQKSKGKRKGQGSRKGAKRARLSKKRAWIMKIRPIRSSLKDLRDNATIDRSTYRKYYRLAKGGTFKSKAHLKSHMIADNVLKEEKYGS